MSVTVDLPPDVEADLAAQAKAQGLSLTEYLRRLLEEKATSRGGCAFSPQERANLWRDSVKDLPDTKPLPDAAISRETIYNTRG